MIQKLKLKKKIILGFLLLSLNTYSFATGILTFDVENWITSIDQLYTNYDMITNAITQLENQYKQIQNAINAAKNIDWTNVGWNGDLDIRNEINGATKNVNKMLTLAREVENSLTEESITIGTARYSLADLCGKGAANKDITTAFKDAKNYMSANMQLAIAALEADLSPEQKKAIWTKYGISPKNYLFIQQSNKQVTDAAEKAIAKTTDKGKELLYTQRTEKLNAILEGVYKTLDENGNITDGAMKEGLLRLAEEIVNGSIEMQDSINEVAKLIATQQIADANKKETESEDESDSTTIDNNASSNAPNNFKREN